MMEEFLIGVGIIAIPATIRQFIDNGKRLSRLEATEEVAKDLLTSRAETVEAKLDAISDNLDVRFDALEKRIDRIERKVLNGSYGK